MSEENEQMTISPDGKEIRSTNRFVQLCNITKIIFFVKKVLT